MKNSQADPADAPPLSAPVSPIVIERNGHVFADSRDVAAFFQKRHDHVLRDIRDLITKEPSLSLSNFGAFKIKDLTGESTSYYEMDRRGFMVLAMGFTGASALKWKLRYIDAFELMEAQLRGLVSVTPREGTD